MLQLLCFSEAHGQRGLSETADGEGAQNLPFEASLKELDIFSLEKSQQGLAKRARLVFKVDPQGNEFHLVL